MDWPRVSRTGEQDCAGAARSRASPSLCADNGISFGLVDGRPVFMDVSDDSYFMLGSDEEAAFLASMGKGRPGLGNPDLSSNPGTPSGPPPVAAECTRPSSSVLRGPEERSRGTFLDALHVWRLLLDTRLALRRRPIAAVLSGCARGGGRAIVGASALMLANRFACARRLVPVPRNCLTDSLALVRWLHKHGAAAILVFGVKLDPFAAHCWVQTDETLLNDHPERVERFTPVRAIECTCPTP